MEKLEIQEAFARYVRAADRRDGPALAALFTPEGRVRISQRDGAAELPIGELAGREAISQAVGQMMRPHPQRGWSHHTTHDPLIAIEGDAAEIDTQFIVFNTLGAETPPGGWPKDALGLQGTVTPVEAGYYRASLRREKGVGEGAWLIEELRILHDLPMALPGGA